jgi:outer membrane protein OmpA-like peptidoglycan-associated protein
MHMKSILLWCAVGWAALGLGSPVVAQSVQWADKVIEVSTEYRDAAYPGVYAAKEARGYPSCNPAVNTKFFECAWSPSDPNSTREEFIKLGYAKPMRVQQVAISECLGAGSVQRVILFDTKGQNHVVYTNPSPGPQATAGRMLNLFFPMTDYECNAVMVVLNCTAVDGPTQIDAVAISDQLDSVKVAINLAPGNLTDGQRENLGPNVNSEHDELLPVISPDGKTLYFTRQGHPGNLGEPDMQDIWISTVQGDNSYSLATNPGRPLNNEDNNATTSITPDGHTLLLLNKYLPDGKMEIGISTAQRNGANWEQPVGCEIKNYYNRNAYGEFSLSASGKAIVMTIQRDDSRGNKDLYVSFLQPDGSWSEPMNLGDSLNTAGGESTPFLAADETTLYFSTNGRVGYGSKDMFITRRLDSTWTKWSAPQNLGPVLNSPAWDAYYSVPAKGDFAYFVSYQNSIGKADIFRAPLPASVRPKPVVLVTGHVLNAKTNAPLAATIVYESLTTGKALGIAHSDPRDGSFSIVLPAGEEYGFLAEAKGFVPVSENIDLRTLTEYQEVKRDLKLVPIESGSIVRLNNLFFESGKAELRPESAQELKRLIDLLKANPTMTIEISGHTDDVGSDVTNLDLSNRRSAAVKNYLTKNGIPLVRLKSVGFGETKFQVPNTDAASRQINRRVEFTILSI